MPRRHSSKQDSLELLLDTICNTFGGVLFIAILVVLLLQQTGTNPAASATPISTPVSEVEMQSLMSRMESVSEDLTRLRQNRDSQDAIVQSFAPDSTRQLLATRSEITVRQESLQSEVDRLRVANTSLVANVERHVVENDAVKTRLEESKSRIGAAQSKLTDERKSREDEVHLPVLRESRRKREVGLILRYGRLYVWHKYDVSGIREGLNTDDFVVVAEEYGGLVTQPKPSAGVYLGESPESQEAVRQVLRRFSPDNVYLVVVARPDSYGVFRHLRDRALELGFEYRLMPAGTHDPVSDRGGSGGKVQ